MDIGFTMRQLVVLALVSIVSACAGDSPGPGPTGTDGQGTDHLDGCPGWDPVIAFDAASTPAGNGFAGAITGRDGFGIMPPPVGSCYAGCTATRVQPYQATYHYRWNDDGKLVDAHYVADGRDLSEGFVLEYVGDELAQITEYELRDGTRSEDEPAVYTFDEHHELLRVNAPGWYTAEYDNTYTGDHLSSVTVHKTSNDGPQTPTTITIRWSNGGEITGIDYEYREPEPGCPPFMAWTIEHDPAGHRVREERVTDSCDGSRTVTELDYEYDEFGRLSRVVETYHPPSGGEADTDAWDFAYDEFGRGIEVVYSYEYESQHQTGTGSSSATTTTSTRSSTVAYSYDCP